MIILALALVSLAVVLSAIVLFLICKHRRVNSNPAPKGPGEVPEPTAQGVNQFNYGFINPNGDDGLRGGIELIPFPDNTNADARARSYPWPIVNFRDHQGLQLIGEGRVSEFSEGFMSQFERENWGGLPMRQGNTFQYGMNAPDSFPRRADNADARASLKP